MNVFTIKDLENLSGIRAHTIRIWEQRYKFLKPGRTQTNIRYYSSDELKTILNVALLNKYGYKISLIDRMDGEEIGQKVLALADKEACLEKDVNELIGKMIDLDLQGFEWILDQYTRTYGIDRAINQVIFPFLDRIGILWQTNHILPAQEHLVSNIIRQKIIVGIDATQPPLHADKMVMLFLPEGEYHELGLLYVYYLLKARGITVLYLGADVSLKDMSVLCKVRRPDYLYTHLTGIAGNFNFDRFVGQIRQHLPGLPLILSGQLARVHMRKIPPEMAFKESLLEVRSFVEQL